MDKEIPLTCAAWEAIKERYNHKCVRCERQEPDVRLAADHIVPMSKGGLTIVENIQPLCTHCNGHKGVKAIDYRTGEKVIEVGEDARIEALSEDIHYCFFVASRRSGHGNYRYAHWWQHGRQYTRYIGKV